MVDYTDDTDDSPDDSWADVIEDFEELEETFRKEAEKNRRKQDEAPPPSTDRQELVTPPSEEYDPDVHLVVPHSEGAEERSVPRRPEGEPPRLSHAMSITHVDSGQSAEGDRGGAPDTDYEIACTIRNVGGTVANTATYELFVEHVGLDAELDTASDGVYELRRDALAGEAFVIGSFTGFCTLKSEPDRLYVLGYVGDEPKPENVLFRTQPGSGEEDEQIKENRTFGFWESALLNPSVLPIKTDKFTVRLYYQPTPVGPTSPDYVSPEERSIDPTKTYLRTSSADDAGDAEPIDLGQLGIPPGDTVKLTQLGKYEKQGTSRAGMIGVFSQSDTLASSDQLHRVVDAIDAGNDFQTDTTYQGDLETDIPEGFTIADPDGTTRSVKVTVPSGAQYLFVSPIDNHFMDNTDQNGEYRLRITSEKKQRESISKSISTLDNEGFLLTETEARFSEAPDNQKKPLNLESNINDAELVDQQKVAVPPTGQTTVTTEYTTPPLDQLYGMTAFYARVYSLSAPDSPPNWDRLDHTTTRFVGRTEFTWDYPLVQL